MAYENLLIEVEGAVMTITINRPKALNALNRATVKELGRAIAEAEANEQVRAVVLTGAGGKAFVAGADITEFTELDPLGARNMARSGHVVMSAVEELPKVVIAAVNGFCLGGGCELALSCDFIVAGEGAKFGQPEVNLGIIPGFGGTQRLARCVGRAAAKAMVYTADMVEAREAKEMGLVYKVVPDDVVLQEARNIAKKIAGKGPIAIAQAKKAINIGFDQDLEAGNSYEQEAFGLVFGTQDRVEGVAAFLEKRKPNFKGR